MLIKLVIGDWSQDGHNMTETYLIESNLSKQDIMKAYNKAAQKSGVDLWNICDEYEDSYMSSESYQKLLDIGVDDKIVLMELAFNDDGYYVRPDSFCRLFLEMVKTQQPNFTYTILDSRDEIHGLGYGLFR